MTQIQHTVANQIEQLYLTSPWSVSSLAATSTIMSLPSTSISRASSGMYESEWIVLFR